MVKKTCWNVDGWVSSTITAEMKGMELLLHGVAGNKEGKVYDWTATVGAQGWTILVQGLRGAEVFQGATFNLPLEVMTAVRRTL